MDSAQREFAAGRMSVRVYGSEADLGRAAAANTAEVIRSAVRARGQARVIIATGNSQLAFIRALRDERDVPWDAVTVFHMDEYVGIDANLVRIALAISTLFGGLGVGIYAIGWLLMPDEEHDTSIVQDLIAKQQQSRATTTDWSGEHKPQP